MAFISLERHGCVDTCRASCTPSLCSRGLLRVADNFWARAAREMMAFRRPLTTNRGRVGQPPLQSTVDSDTPETPRTDNQLVVNSVDLLLGKNQPAHHTDQYENKELVVRRGQEFDVEITLAQRYDPAARHAVSVELRLGESTRHDVHIVIPLRQSGVATEEVDEWNAKVIESKVAKLTVRIRSPSDCLIGRYKMTVSTKVCDAHAFNFSMDGHIYMLFNPWCQADDVYMHDEAQRKEYVLNDMGMYFYGTNRYVGSARWYYGQFEDGILQCVIGLLENANKRSSAYSSPVEISRLLSALVNAPDDGGILVGNWSGDYEGGTEPTAWSGSTAIFEEYRRTGLSVRYGQCWVFGGLLTTVGIPARTITNFDSAHDADANCLLDYHFDADGSPLDNDDSIWNFHVWNDAWMVRPDLPKGYGGWQAVDATPQEYSDYVFRTGPASLTAIKNGHVYLSYDTKFVFAEVNACKVKWLKSWDPSEPDKMISLETDGVGTCILTKAVGKMEKEDITLQYKHKEGSLHEYLSLFAADKYVESLKKLLPTAGQDTNLTIILPEDVLIGKDFTVKARLTKTCPVGELRKAKLAMTCNTMYYTGVKARQVFQTYDSVNIDGREAVHEWQVKASDYLPQLVDQANMRFLVTMFVTETSQLVTKSVNFRLTKPDLKVEVPTSVAIGESFTVTVTFTNPLSTMLQECFFDIEGPAIQLHKKEAFRNIKGNEEVQYKGTVKAKRPPGTKEVLAFFLSLDLIGVSGSAFITIS